MYIIMIASTVSYRVTSRVWNVSAFCKKSVVPKCCCWKKGKTGRRTGVTDFWKVHSDLSTLLEASLNVHWRQETCSLGWRVTGTNYSFSVLHWRNIHIESFYLFSKTRSLYIAFIVLESAMLTSPALYTQRSPAFASWVLGVEMWATPPGFKPILWSWLSAPIVCSP